MKNKQDIDRLKRFLKIDPSRKVLLAGHFHFSTTDAIDKWIARETLPKAKRFKILQYVEETEKISASLRRKT